MSIESVSNVSGDLSSVPTPRPSEENGGLAPGIEYVDVPAEDTDRVTLDGLTKPQVDPNAWSILSTPENRKTLGALGLKIDALKRYGKKPAADSELIPEDISDPSEPIE